jgi:putative ABC transport system substrate-binding protein
MARRVLVLGSVHPTALVNGLVTTLRDQLSTTAAGVDVGYRGYPADYHDRLLDIAAEIDTLRPAVIVGWGPRCARVEGYLHRPPVVFIVSGDPATLSLGAGPKLSGLTTTGTAGVPRAQVALIAELQPTARRVAVLWDPTDGNSVRSFNDTAEPTLDARLRRESLEVRHPGDLDAAFAVAAERDVDAVCVASSPLSVAHAPRIVQLAEAHHLPLVADLADFAYAGALAAYGASLSSTFRRAAVHVRRFLDGGRGNELGVERMAVELVVNVRTAQALGVAIPPSLLARADRRVD